MAEDNRMAEIKDMLQDLLTWYKAVNFSALQKTLKDALPDEARQVAYECTAEKTTAEDIAKLLSKLGHTVSPRTISRWQSEWVTKGLETQLSRKRKQRNFSLVDFDISLPPTLAKILEGGQEASDSKPKGEVQSEPQDKEQAESDPEGA